MGVDEFGFPIKGRIVFIILRPVGTPLRHPHFAHAICSGVIGLDVQNGCPLFCIDICDLDNPLFPLQVKYWNDCNGYGIWARW